MSTTCMYSDILLPATHFYERRGIKYAQSYVPFYVVGDKCAEPQGETKTEWERRTKMSCCGLAESLAAT